QTPLDPDSHTFLTHTLHHTYGITPTLTDLTPSLTTDYLRTTLVTHGQRITCDAALTCTDLHTHHTIHANPQLVLVETKTTGHLTEADRLLHGYGIRPAVFTKYCGAFAALRPESPANRWRRAARCAFGASA
ncbi:VTC domain-containing protein, partial [Streptomyces sp. NPDC002537]